MMQEPGVAEQLSQNITRQGLTNTTLNFLRVSSAVCFSCLLIGLLAAFESLFECSRDAKSQEFFSRYEKFFPRTQQEFSTT